MGCHDGFCCEQDIATDKAEVMLRQDKTTDMAYHFWEEYRDCPWAWVPTIQGWNVDDYIRHANELKPLVYEMKTITPMAGELVLGRFVSELTGA